MKQVIILRGLPGAGKSTVCAMLQPCAIVSMDLFWVRSDGTYKFDHTKLKESIEWAQQQFVEYLDSPVRAYHRIVVDNLSYCLEHFRFYVEEAKKRHAIIHVLHVERPLNELSNVHGVPFSTVARQADLWEPYI